MVYIIPFPIFLLMLILQLSVFSNMPLLQGTADIVMLALIAWTMQKETRIAYVYAIVIGFLMGTISALPIPIYLLTYFLIVFFARYLQKRIWQTPILAMLSLSVVGTIILHILSIIILQLTQVPITFQESLGLVILPSILLNLLISIPIYLFAVDLAGWLYPEMEN